MKLQCQRVSALSRQQGYPFGPFSALRAVVIHCKQVFWLDCNAQTQRTCKSYAQLPQQLQSQAKKPSLK